MSSATGAICLDILKDQWAAALTLRTVLQKTKKELFSEIFGCTFFRQIILTLFLFSIQALLAAPEPGFPGRGRPAAGRPAPGARHANGRPA